MPCWPCVRRSSMASTMTSGRNIHASLLDCLQPIHTPGPFASTQINSRDERTFASQHEMWSTRAWLTTQPARMLRQWSGVCAWFCQDRSTVVAITEDQFSIVNQPALRSSGAIVVTLKCLLNGEL